MKEQIRPGDYIDRPHYTTFEQNIANLNEEERDLAERMIEIYHGYAAAINKSKAYEFVINFCKDLIKKKGDEVVRHCKLFHLLIGSSLSDEQWREYPMDTQDNDIEKFMSKSLSNFLSDIEKLENNPQ